MSTNHRTGKSFMAPVHRHCSLCGQTKTIYPVNDEHRRAHLSRQLAFVCDECAVRVRMEVEAASQPVHDPRVIA